MDCNNASLVSAIIVAGGKGRRMGRGVPKQYLKVGGISVLCRTLSVFVEMDEIDEIVVVVPGEDVEFVTQELIPAELGQMAYRKPIVATAGGATRQQSARAGLAALGERSRIVLIHDAARPFVSQEHISRVIASAHEHGGAILAVPVKDTLKFCEGGFITGTAAREGVFAAQTPQAFHTAKLVRAHDLAVANSITVTDDAALFEELGYEVAVVEGSYLNMKITTEEDLAMAQAILAESLI
ncbi:MAG: 2-C-methyl-D-erythritol 4-phosphate cytidylyltransferase [Defluviitaleaceae bacterium]|nr:2-C-methyl-D-erythritol 4-phosphate cytidylyltransferase [Defluviitaleaceae bacterium]